MTSKKECVLAHLCGKCAVVYIDFCYATFGFTFVSGLCIDAINNCARAFLDEWVKRGFESWKEACSLTCSLQN